MEQSRSFFSLFSNCNMKGKYNPEDRTKIQGGQGENTEQTKEGKRVQKRQIRDGCETKNNKKAGWMKSSLNLVLGQVRKEVGQV